MDAEDVLHDHRLLHPSDTSLCLSFPSHGEELYLFSGIVSTHPYS